MSRRPRGTRPAIVVATLLTAGLALGGCSAGSVTQTDTIVSQADGATGQVGGILLRDVSLDAGPTEHRALGRGGPPASDDHQPDPDGGPARVGHLAVRRERPAGGPDDDPGRTTPCGSSATTPARSARADPFVRVGGSARIVLTGVTQQLRPGPTYEVTFTFEKAGTVTVPVIVVGEGDAEG